MPESAPASPHFGLHSTPVAALPQLQQLILPTPWEVGPVQIYVILGDPTAWQVWQSLFSKADPVTQMRTRMLMVIGGLDVLEDEGRVEPRRRDDEVLTDA